MSIDLTGPDEQDWADGEKAPPIRYSEMTTDDERTSDAVEQLKEPLMEVLTTHYRSTESSASVLDQQTAELTANMLLIYLNFQPDFSVQGVFDSVAAPDTDQSDWMDEYLHRVAQRVVKNTSDSSLTAICSIASDDGPEYREKKKAPASPDSLQDEHDVRQSE